MKSVYFGIFVSLAYSFSFPHTKAFAGSPFIAGIATPARHQNGDLFISYAPVLTDVPWRDYTSPGPLTVPIQIDLRDVYWSEESGTIASTYRGGTGRYFNLREAHNFIAPGSGAMACGGASRFGLPPIEHFNSISFSVTYGTSGDDSSILSDDMDAGYDTPVRGYVAPGGMVALQYRHTWVDMSNGHTLLEYDGTWTRDTPGYFEEPLAERQLIPEVLGPNASIRLSTYVRYSATAGDEDGSASFIYNYDPPYTDTAYHDAVFTEACNPSPSSMAISNAPENNVFDFGLVRAGTFKRMPAFTVTNVAPDTQLSFSLPTRNLADFDQPTNLGHFWPVPAGTFIPMTTYLFTGEHQDYDYVIESADRGAYQHIVSVPNAGEMASFLLVANSVGPVAALDVPLLYDPALDREYYALDFGNVEPGAEVTRTITLRNASDDPNDGNNELTDLGLFSYEVLTDNSNDDLFSTNGETAGDFPSGTTLAKGESLSFSITFQAPTENGFFTGQWRATTDEGWDVGAPWGSMALMLSATVGDDSTPVVGDLDGDGVVGRFDAILLAELFGYAGDGADAADLDRDGVVGLGDLGLLQANLGRTTISNQAAVPEPATAALVALGFAFMVLGRRCRYVVG